MDNKINPSDIDIHTLLPQQEPFVMIGKLTACSEEGVTTETVIKPSNIFAADGRFHTAGMVENIAQSCAARMGYVSKYIKHDGIKIGVIGSVRKLKILGHPKAGDTITTKTDIIDEVMGVTLAVATISVGDELMAKGQIKLAESGAAPDMSKAVKPSEAGADVVAHKSICKFLSSENTDDGYLETLELDPECFIYKAHFPENPVTPGVVILQTACDALSRQQGSDLEIAAIKDARFLNILSPKDTKTVEVSLSGIATDDDGNVTAQVSVSHGDTVFANIKFTCTEKEKEK